MNIEWVVLCQSAEEVPGSDLLDVHGAGIHEFVPNELPTELVFTTAVMVTDVAAQVDDHSAVQFEFFGPGAQTFSSYQLRMTPQTESYRDTPGRRRSFAVLGSRLQIAVPGEYRVKVSGGDASPVIKSIVVTDPVEPSP